MPINDCLEQKGVKPQHIDEIGGIVKSFTDKGLSESDAGIEAVKEFHKKLSSDLNDLKKSVGVKQDKYVEPTKHEQTKNDFDNQIEQVKSEQANALRDSKNAQSQKDYANYVKDKLKNTFKQQGEDITDEQADAAIALMDARAKSWASEEAGRTPEQWWQNIDAGTGKFQGGDVRYQQALANSNAIFETRDGKPIGYNYDTDKTARERFNIPQLKQIGKGSDRTVFDLGNGTVLKVAHSPRGLEQNIQEGDGLLSGNVIPEVHERGLNYVVADNIPKMKASDIVPTYDVETGERNGSERASKMIDELGTLHEGDYENHTQEAQDILNKYGLGDVLHYDVLDGDFSRIANWGYKDGKPYHIDAGTFGGRDMLTRYYGKKPLSDPEFRDIYSQSRQLKKQYQDQDKFTKFQVMPHDVTLPNGQKGTTMPDVVNGFYSPLEKTLSETKLDNLPAKQWIDKFGKGEEAKWTGLTNWLSEQKGNVSKSDIQKFLRDNRIQVVEVHKGGKEQSDYNKYKNELINKYGEDNFEFNASPSELKKLRDLEDNYAQVGAEATKYSNYQTPGDKENYKEVLVTMPNKKPSLSEVSNKLFGKDINDLTKDEKEDVIDEHAYQSGKGVLPKFKSSHFDEQNILVHLRMNTRKDANGNKVLFLEEVQSDWGQKGKKEGFAKPNEKLVATMVGGEGGYWEVRTDNGRFVANVMPYEATTKDEAISEVRRRISNEESYRISKGQPEAPFVTDTNDWTKLGLKVALKEAAKQGADKIAWTTGEQQNERYDLSKQVDALRYSKNDDGTYQVYADKDGNTVFSNDKLKESELENHVGKDVAKRIINGEGKEEGHGIFATKELTGEKLSVGGTGMKGFYGSPKEGKLGIIGNVAKSLFKQEPKEISIEGAKKGIQHGAIDSIWLEDNGKLLTDNEKKNYEFNDRENLYTIERHTAYRLRDKDDITEANDVYVVPKFGRGDLMPQHSIDITPELKKQAEQGLPLFQKNKEGIARGATETLSDGGTVIHAMNSPNIDTFVHEIHHVFEKDLTDEERKTFADWSKSDIGSTKYHEAFANAGVRYLRDGIAPTKELQPLFQRFKEWLTNIYKSIVNTPLVKKLSPEVKQIFDRLLTEKEQPQKGIKSAWESNIEALVHPETGLSATMRKIAEEQQPLKDAFLKRIGLTIEDYGKLNDADKEKIQQQWVKSKEFNQLDKQKNQDNAKDVRGYTEQLPQSGEAAGNGKEVSSNDVQQVSPKPPISPDIEQQARQEGENKGEEKDLGAKARDLAQQLRSGEKNVLPSWLRADLPKGVQKGGISLNEAFANALDAFAAVHDATKDFAKAIAEGFKHLKGWFEDNNVPYDEKDLKSNFEAEMRSQMGSIKTVGASHESLSKLADNLGLPKIERGEVVSPEEYTKRGQLLVKNGADPQAIADEFEKTGKVNVDDVSVAKAHLADLTKDANDIRKQLGKDSEQFKEAIKKVDDWARNVVKPMGTKWGEIGRTLQGETELDTGNFVSMQRGFEEYNKRPMTPQEEKQAEDLSNQVSKLTDEVNDLKQKLTDALNKGEEAQKGNKTFAAKAKNIADAFRKLKTKPFTFKDENGNDIPINIQGVTWNDLVELGAKAIEKTGEIADGIAAIIDKIKDSDFYNKLSANDKQRFQDQLQSHYESQLEDTPAAKNIKRLEKELDDLKSGKIKQTAQKRDLTEREKELHEQIFNEKKKLGLIKSKTESPHETTQNKQQETQDLASRFANKKDNNFSIKDAKDIWDYAKENYLDNDADFGRMVNGVATDLGLTTDQVRHALATPKDTKRITDEMYRKQYERRKAQQKAEYFVKRANESKLSKIAKFIPRLFFNIKTFGHGTVGFITHGGTNIFNPQTWKIYFPLFMKQFKFSFGGLTKKGLSNYEQAMEDFKNLPHYPFWKRMGLSIDPDKVYDDYQNTIPALKRMNEMGDRGFNALKLLRYYLAEHSYNNLSALEKADPQTAKNIASIFNHGTGTSDIKLPETSSILFFAPRLEASRWARLITQPAKALATFANWDKATDADKVAAKIVAKRAGNILGTYALGLAINQGLLAALGSKQKINGIPKALGGAGFNPNESDFLKFKGGGRTLDLSGGLISTIDFLSQLGKISTESKENLKRNTRGDLLTSATGRYVTGKFSPFMGTVKDFATHHDFEGNTMPFSDDKPLKGKHKLTWGQYLKMQQSPIPVSEAFKDIHKQLKDNGMNESEADRIIGGIIVGGIMGSTGARIGEEPPTTNLSTIKKPNSSERAGRTERSHSHTHSH